MHNRITANDAVFYRNVCILRHLLAKNLITQIEYEKIRDDNKKLLGAKIILF